MGYYCFTSINFKIPQLQPKFRIAEHATVVIHLGGCNQQFPRPTEAKQRLGVLHRNQRITGTVDKQHGAWDVHHPVACRQGFLGLVGRSWGCCNHVDFIKHLGDFSQNGNLSNKSLRTSQEWKPLWAANGKWKQQKLGSIKSTMLTRPVPPNNKPPQMGPQFEQIQWRTRGSLEAGCFLLFPQMVRIVHCSQWFYSHSGSL